MLTVVPNKTQEAPPAPTPANDPKLAKLLEDLTNRQAKEQDRLLKRQATEAPSPLRHEQERNEQARKFENERERYIREYENARKPADQVRADEKSKGLDQTLDNGPKLTK